MNEITLTTPAELDTNGFQHAMYPPDRNPALVYLAGLSESSRRPMSNSLRTIADIFGIDAQSFPWGDLRFQHTNAIRQALADADMAYSTANRHLAALRGTLKAAWMFGYMTVDEYQKAVAFKPVQGEGPDAAAGRALSSGEVFALMGNCATDSNQALGIRDAAIIALGVTAGLRRAEIAGLQMGHYNDGVLTVHGKRNKVRTVPLGESATATLVDWIAQRGDDDGPLFRRVLRGGRIVDSGITAQAIYKMLAARAAAVGVKEFTPHDMRRTFAGDLLDAGADISTVQKLMGHANANTTAGYDRRGERAKKSAVDKLHVPWSGWVGQCPTRTQP